MPNTDSPAPAADRLSGDPIADLETVARQAAAGGVLDPELLRRVRERSAVVRARLRREQGESDFAVGLIREVREEG